MMWVDIRPAARDDLREIWEFIAKDNPAAADNYIRFLNSKMVSLSDFMLIGRERPEIAPGLHSYVVGSHVIFYLADQNEGIIFVERILHVRRDIQQIFSNDE